MLVILNSAVVTSVSSPRSRGQNADLLQSMLSIRHFEDRVEELHPRSDRATYRPVGELDRWLERDPVLLERAADRRAR